MAALAACHAINSFGGTFTVDSSGNGTDKYTDPGTQVLANGETITYSWSGNTKGAYVYVIYTQNGGSSIAPNTLPQSTAVNGSGSFTFSGTMSGDYLQMGLSNYPPYDANPVANPSTNDSSVQITISCSASTTLGVTMSHSGNAVQSGSLAYTITPSISGGATTTATLTAAFSLPSGMSYVSASGTGWTCSGSGQSGSCTRNTSFAAGSGPAITVNTSFASNASSPLAPSVQLPGGGASNTATASDSTTVLSTPTITSISPTSGPTSGGTSVTITGTGLSGTTSVVFGGTAASGFTNNSNTQVTATAPAGTGTVDVRVTTAAGTSATSAADQFTYVSAPTVSAYTASAVAYGATGVTFSLAGQATNSPTSFAVGSATTANGGTVSINSSGLVTYSAPAGYRGNDSFTYTASNGGGTSSPATVTVPVGNPTLSASLTGSGTRGTALSGVQIVTTGGTAPYSCSTTLASGALPAGTQLNSNCTITGTPSASGSFSFTANVTDSSVRTGFTQATGSLSLVIASPSVTLSPAAGALPAATAGTSYSQSFTAGSGTAPYTCAVTAGTLPAGLVLSGSTVTGTPSEAGTFNFTVTATDSASAGSGGPYSVSKSYSIAVGAPTIVLMPASLTGATVGAAYTQAMTSSGGTAPYTYSLYAGTLPPGLSLATNGTLSGTPTATGTFNFTVVARDTTAGTGSPYGVAQNYNFTVSPPNAPAGPVSATVAYNAAATSITLALSGQTATSVAVASPPTHGTAAANGLAIEYTPTPGYYGADSFTYTATNARGTSAPATVSITVGTPAAPTVSNRSNVSVPYDGGATAIDLSASITGVHASITVATAPAHGTTSVAGDVVTYTPAAGYNGADSFTYTATGPGGTSAPATVGLVIATPAAPTVADRTGVEVANGSTGTAIDLGGAITGVHTSIAIATAPAHGTTSVAGNVVTYTPAAGYAGADSFTYTATGPGGTSAPATVSVTVAAPAPPTAANRSGVAVDYNSPGTPIDLSASVSGVYTSLAVASAPARGVTSVSGNVIAYTPANGAFGADSFTYTATGPGGTSAPATVSVTVATPPPPAAVPVSSTVPAATAVQPRQQYRDRPVRAGQRQLHLDRDPDPAGPWHIDVAHRRRVPGWRDQRACGGVRHRGLYAERELCRR